MDEKQQQAENNKLREELRSAYFRCFNTDDGRKVMKDLEIFCGFRASSVCEHNPNAMQTAFAEGKRRTLLRILSMTEKQNDGNS